MNNIIRWRKYTKSLFGIDEVAKGLLINCILPVAKSGWEVGGELCIRRVCSFFLLQIPYMPIKNSLSRSLNGYQMN